MYCNGGLGFALKSLSIQQSLCHMHWGSQEQQICPFLPRMQDNFLRISCFNGNFPRAIEYISSNQRFSVRLVSSCLKPLLGTSIAPGAMGKDGFSGTIGDASEFKIPPLIFFGWERAGTED